jgi:hypothetical protein
MPLDHRRTVLNRHSYLREVDVVRKLHVWVPLMVAFVFITTWILAVHVHPRV